MSATRVLNADMTSVPRVEIRVRFEKIFMKTDDGKEFLWRRLRTENGVPKGIAWEYYPSGEIRREWFHGDDGCTGEESFFTETGVLISENKDGVLKEYYPNGQLKSLNNCGLQTYREYYINGDVKVSRIGGDYYSYYLGGVPRVVHLANGLYTSYFPNGRVRFTRDFSNPNVPLQVFNRDGTLIYSAMLKDFDWECGEYTDNTLTSYTVGKKGDDIYRRVTYYPSYLRMVRSIEFNTRIYFYKRNGEVIEL
jgi:antitoxin component YwqK of YwqJK toxin-antitoxin module